MRHFQLKRISYLWGASSLYLPYCSIRTIKTYFFIRQAETLSICPFLTSIAGAKVWAQKWLISECWREKLFSSEMWAFCICEKFCCLTWMAAVRHSALQWAAPCILVIRVFHTRVFGYWLSNIWCLVFQCLKGPWMHNINKSWFGGCSVKAKLPVHTHFSLFSNTYVSLSCFIF